MARRSRYNPFGSPGLGRPSGPLTINRDSPLAAGLRDYIVFPTKAGRTLNSKLSVDIGGSSVVSRLEADSGLGLDFDGGTSATVRLANHSHQTAFTLACWLVMDAAPSTDRAFLAMTCSDDFPATEWSGGLILNTSGQLVGYCYDGAAQSITSSALTAGTLYHVAGTWGSGVAQKIYVNGALAASGSIGTLFSAWSSGPVVRLGGRGSGADTDHLNGYIADPVYFDRVLSAAEVWQLANPPTQWELITPPRARIWVDVAGVAVGLPPSFWQTPGHFLLDDEDDGGF